MMNSALTADFKKMFQYCLESLHNSSSLDHVDLSQFEDRICRCELLRHILPKRDYILNAIWEDGSVSILEEDQLLLNEYMNGNGDFDTPSVKRYDIWNQDGNEKMQFHVSDDEFRMLEVRNLQL
jgi:hypothetical protein